LQLELQRAFGASNAGQIVGRNLCSHGIENEIMQNKKDQESAERKGFKTRGSLCTWKTLIRLAY